MTLNYKPIRSITTEFPSEHPQSAHHSARIRPLDLPLVLDIATRSIDIGFPSAISARIYKSLIGT